MGCKHVTETADASVGAAINSLVDIALTHLSRTGYELKQRVWINKYYSQRISGTGNTLHQSDLRDRCRRIHL